MSVPPIEMIEMRNQIIVGKGRMLLGKLGMVPFKIYNTKKSVLYFFKIMQKVLWIQRSKEDASSA